MQNQKLYDLLDNVSTNIPFYKSYKKKDIINYPFVTKNVIKNNYDDFLSDRLINKDQVVQELKNPMKLKNYIIEKPLKNGIFLEWTTGSSGIPFKCIKSKTERNIMSLNIWKKRLNFDRRITPAKFFPLIHTGDKVIPFNIRDYSSENLKGLYDYIEKSGCNTIHTTPTLLKRHLVDSKVDQSIFHNKVQFIESTGSFLSQDNKRLYEEILNAQIFNFYGLIELWTIGTTCRNGNMHINADNIYMELIDKDQKVIKEKHKVGQIAVTGLHQYMMPFIRYLTGDYAEYTDIVCKCGDRDPIINLLENREIHYLEDKNKEIMDGNKFVKTLLRYVFWKHEFSEINYFCLIKKESEYVFYLNWIENSDLFERLVSNELFKKMGNEIKISYKYITLEEFEELNVKNHLFINKSRKKVLVP